MSSLLVDKEDDGEADKVVDGLTKKVNKECNSNTLSICSRCDALLVDV